MAAMYHTGGYWAKGDGERTYCYRIIPLDIAQDPAQMTLKGFDIVYQALGALWYRFRDAGHNSEYVLVSLNKPLSPAHLRKLEDVFSIAEDTGSELVFA